MVACIKEFLLRGNHVVESKRTVGLCGCQNGLILCDIESPPTRFQFYRMKRLGFVRVKKPQYPLASAVGGNSNNKITLVKSHTPADTLVVAICELSNRFACLPVDQQDEGALDTGEGIANVRDPGTCEEATVGVEAHVTRSPHISREFFVVASHDACIEGPDVLAGLQIPDMQHSH